MRWLIWTWMLWSHRTCAVCAVDVSVVDDALAFLGCRAKVVTIDPHTLAEVDESILRLGEVTGRWASVAL